jgi:adenylate cyclase
VNVYTRRRIEATLKVALACVPVSFVIRYIEIRGVNPGSFVIGFTMGLVIGVFEFFIFRDRLRNLPFVPHLLVKAAVLAVMLYAGAAGLLWLDVVLGDKTVPEYLGDLVSQDMLVFLVLSFALAVMILFVIQLNRLLGPGNLGRFVSGRYHRPRKEPRIFMFIDLKDSTRIAEQMEADRYYAFLNRFFSDMSEPILETDAEIYQYVGDEIVLTWPLEDGRRNANAIRVFFEIQKHLEGHREAYEREYGLMPEFKAGAHWGDVISAQIGDLKREIVYNGDVLNTTARIQSVCNQLGRQLLASAELVDALDLESRYDVEMLGEVELKGKERGVALCAIAAPR